MPFGARRVDEGRPRRQSHREPPQTILVVEDEQSIASFVSLYLKNAGYGVRAVGTGAGALNAVAAEMPSLIMLDLNLPDMDGIEICRRVRKSSDVPILMLTARDEDVDKIIGLEVGADDYLTKPFNPRELVARVKSVLRRATLRPPASTRATRSATATSSINAGRREVLVGDDEIQLAPKEFDLLWELLDHRGSCSPATSCSSACGATPSPATRGRSTSTSARSGASSGTRRRSSPCGASATRSRPSARPLPPRRAPSWRRRSGSGLRATAYTSS